MFSLLSKFTVSTLTNTLASPFTRAASKKAKAKKPKKVVAKAADAKESDENPDCPKSLSKQTAKKICIQKFILPRKSSTESYDVVCAQKSDHDQILEMVREDFFKDEPISVAMGFTKPTKEMEEEVMEKIKEGYTMVAKCPENGCILGACINYKLTPNCSDLDEKIACALRCNNEKLSQFYYFFAYCRKHPDLFKMYKVTQIFELGLLMVKKEARNHGIAFNLFSGSRDFGADCGFQLIKTDATSHFTALLCEKMNMKKVAEIPYHLYVDEDNNQIINSEKPHCALKVYVDDWPQRNAIAFQEAVIAKRAKALADKLEKEGGKKAKNKDAKPDSKKTMKRVKVAGKKAKKGKQKKK